SSQATAISASVAASARAFGSATSGTADTHPAISAPCWHASQPLVSKPHQGPQPRVPPAKPRLAHVLVPNTPPSQISVKVWVGHTPAGHASVKVHESTVPLPHVAAQGGVNDAIAVVAA